MVKSCGCGRRVFPGLISVGVGNWPGIPLELNTNV